MLLLDLKLEVRLERFSKLTRFFVFRSTEIFITRIRMRYTEFIISLSNPNSSVHIKLKIGRKERNLNQAFGFLTQNLS